MKISNIMGKKVLDMNANRVGKVNDIDFDLTDGVINAIEISTGVMKKKIQIKPEDIKTVGDTIILNVSKDEIL